MAKRDTSTEKQPSGAAQSKPNILVIWGDDIGVHNISAYNHGIMGYRTPNIDRIAKEGALFTDGAETFSWPDGGTTPFHGEKGTTWEGGFRVPLVVRWPGVINPGTIYNDIISQEDWMPTLLAAAGEPDIVEKLKNGYTAHGKKFKIHADGYNFMPYFKGEVKKGPREEIYYFSQGGELNAIRVQNWKIHFATQVGNIATGTRSTPGWPLLVNLRADPYEKGPNEADLGYLRWYGDNLWTFVPAQGYIKKFLATLPDYPFQEGSSLNAAGINYNSLKAAAAMKRLQEMESIALPGS